MACQKIDSPIVALVTPVVNDAVGVSGPQWFVAIVRCNTEKKVADRLSEAGYKTYVPLQREERVWRNGRKKIVDRVVIPSMVFVNCNETQRREIVGYSFINRFMIDRAAAHTPTGMKPFAVIPEWEIQKLRFIVENSPSPVTVSDSSYRKGEKVRIVRGNMKGLEGEVEDADGLHSRLVISLDILGNARLMIDTNMLERI